MKKVVFRVSLAIILIGILLFGLSRSQLVRNYLDDYGVRLVEEQFGSLSLKPEYEALIKAIAQEMGITQKIIIYKANTTATSLFGYHNAFIIHPQLFGFIPISDQALMYVSEGMLEELTYPEQRFLIGHELIHAREHHLLFEPLIFLLLAALLLLASIGYLLYLYHRKKINQYVLYGLIGVSVFSIYWSCWLGLMAYRRQQEDVADCESLRLLNAYEGFFTLNQRFQKEAGAPKHNIKFYGLLADHPSCYEREQRCLELQKNSTLCR